MKYGMNAHGRGEVDEMELTAVPVDEPNLCVVLQAVMAATALRPGGTAEGEMDDDVTHNVLLSKRPTMFQNSEVDMQDSVGILKKAVDDAVGHGLPLENANMSCELISNIFYTHPDVFIGCC